MRLGSALLGVAAAWSLTTGAATATTLTTSYAIWAANAGVGQVNTQTTGQLTPLDPFATVSSVNLPLGAIGLSDATTVVVQPPSGPYGGFPFDLSNGFTGDLFLPTANSVTFTLPSDISALGFYVATYSNNAVPTPPVGGYTITVTLANGASQSFSTSGGDFGTGVTPAGFFGYYGGAIASLTISDTDPSGFAFGNFFSVPEPASAALLLVGVAGLLQGRRRIA